jgi:hypothetical protein
LIPDPAPERIKTLLYATPPFDYVADTASQWAELGFGGFFRPDVVGGWEADIWTGPDGVRTVGQQNALLKQCLRMNECLKEVGVTENVISVSFTKLLPDWFDDEAWKGIIENFRQDARFAKMGGFIGVALDLEYIEEQWGLHWQPYQDAGYLVEDLREQALLRGYQIQRAMLSAFAGMLTFQLPETYSINGELAKDMFVGSVKALAEADAPGGMHICPECTYFQILADLMIGRYGYGFDRVLLDSLEPAQADYWSRRCTVALGLAPLGYLRPIWGKDGRRLGFGGRKEVFGDRLIQTGEDKSGNYPPEVFHQNYAAARMACRRYVWVFTSGPCWWRMTPEEYATYGGAQTVTLPLIPNFEEYAGALRAPSLIDTPEMMGIAQAVQERRPIDVLSGLGVPPYWWVIGPFPNTGGEGYDHVHPPELAVNLGAEHTGIVGPVKWSRQGTPPMGYVDLSRLIAGGVDIQGYAATSLDVSEPTPAVLRFGCDDTGKIWLNKELIHGSNTERRAMPDEDQIPVVFRKGQNQILVKIGNYKGGWGFYLRVTDDAGEEIQGLRWTA